MDFSDTPEEAAYREEVRAWLRSNAPTSSMRVAHGYENEQSIASDKAWQARKADAGYACITWPVEWGGGGGTPVQEIIFREEESRLGIGSAIFGLGLGMCIPTILTAGSDADKARFVRPAMRGEEIWCQLFSEPSSGSDVAASRTRAVRSGDGSGDWIIDGQKVWTSGAHFSDFGLLLARTDPDVPKHKGLTMFWVDMKAPGVTVRPIKLAGGDSHVNEVFFDEVKIGDDHRMSPVGGGFAVAMATLMIERYVATDSGGFGPHLDLFVELAKAIEINGRPAIEDGRIRQQIARNYAMRSGLDAITARAMAMMQAGMTPGPEGSLNKLVSVRSRQKLSELAIDLQGSGGFAFDDHAAPKENWTASWINAPTGRIAGGADEMLLNTIAEKILGLPQDHRPDKGVPFNQIPA